MWEKRERPFREGEHVICKATSKTWSTHRETTYDADCGSIAPSTSGRPYSSASSDPNSWIRSSTSRSLRQKTSGVHLTDTEGAVRT